MRLNILKNKPELLKHSLSLLASLIIHAALIYTLAAYFVSVKIIDFGEQVTPVIIASPEELHLPKIEGNLPNPQDWREQFPEFRPRRAQPLQEPTTIPKETGTVEERQESFAGPVINPKLTSEFRLDQGLPEKPESASDKNLRFFLPLAAKTSPESLAVKKSLLKNVDLRQYLYSILPGGRGSSPGVHYGGRQGATSLRGRSPAPSVVKNYDLSPWARNVAELIQKNWMIPSTQAAGPNDTAEIAVVILKNGEISSAEIIVPSENKSFDQAALEAIEVSSPLPPLPDDFPAASLKISFVFSKQ
jgi:TonB family protein